MLLNLSQLKADLEALDHKEKVRHLEKTNFQPTDKSHIEFMKEKFKKRWSTANTKLSIATQSTKQTDDDDESKNTAEENPTSKAMTRE